MENRERYAGKSTNTSHLSQRAQDAALMLASMCLLGITACATQPPIIADPPQHTHTPPEIVPWEEQYERARPKPEAFEESVSERDSQPFSGDLEQTAKDKEGDGPFQVVVDVIAFPFRGVGWLLQEVF
jgi:hypothetical protein